MLSYRQCRCTGSFEKIFSQCNEFLTFFREDNKLGVTDSTYIWSVQDEHNIPDIIYVLKTSKPWVCYQDQSFFPIVGRQVTDTVKFSAEDMNYMLTNLSAKHDDAWRNKFEGATGILAEEPRLNPNILDYILLSPPLFLQNNTVCVVYKEIENKSIGYNHICFRVYKKDSQGWVLIGDRLWAHGCRSSKNNRKHTRGAIHGNTVLAITTSAAHPHRCACFFLS